MAVATVGTVQGAADFVKITQTGVTQRLKALESSLGVGLFQRSRKGMILTAEGQALYRYCQKVLELEGETLALLDKEGGFPASQLKRLTLAGPSSLIRARVIPSLRNIAAEHPNLRYSFEIEDSPEQCLARLKDASIDLAIVPREFVGKELESKILTSEAYVLAVPKSWAKRALSEIVKSEILIDFNEKDRLSFNFLEKAGVLSSFAGERHYVNNTDALASMIEMGMGYSVLSKEFAEPLLANKKIARVAVEVNFNIQFALAWYPRSLNPAYFEATLAAIP